MCISGNTDALDENGYNIGSTYASPAPNGASNENTHTEAELCTAQNPYYDIENDSISEGVKEGVIGLEVLTIINNTYYE